MRRRSTRSMNAFKIFPSKITLAYFAGVTIILVASSLVVIVGLAQVSSANFTITNNKSLSGISIGEQGTPFTNGTVITEQASRTIYTSTVPETVADGINNLLTNSSASSSLLSYPMTVSLVSADGNVPLVVRGLPIRIIQKAIPEISSLQPAENWTILGAQAAKELNARTGSVLTVEDPLSNTPVKLTVSGIHFFGNEADYEALVPLDLGQEIGGLSNGVVNAIVAPSNIISKFNLQTLVSSEYFVKLEYSGPPGTIDIVDSTGFVHIVLSAFGSVSNSNFIQKIFNFSLPFAYYTLVLDQNGIRTQLDEFTPSTNGTTIDAALTRSGVSFLSVKNDNASSSATPSPKLVNSSNETILPQNYNQTSHYWVFQVSQQGDYTLVLPNGTNITNLLIVGNSTYDPLSSTLSKLLFNSTLNVEISSPVGLTNGFTVTVRDMQNSQVLFSRFSTSNSLSIPVQSNHTYTISVLSSETSFLLQENVSMSRAVQTASFTFPAIPFDLSSVPISDYSSLGIGSPSKSASFILLIGGAVASAVALFAIVLALLSLGLIALSKQLLLSLQKEIRAINFLFPSKSAIRTRVKLPMFLLLFAAMASAVLISFALFQFLGFSDYVTFLGYGIEVFPVIFILPVSFALALISYFKISTTMDREIF